jgi:hypothetical protein
MKFSLAGLEKGDLLIHTGDCLIEVTTWAGFTVISKLTMSVFLSSNTQEGNGQLFLKITHQV